LSFQGLHKASFAENYIKLTKRRLYRICRTKLTKDWCHYLDSVVRAINNSPSSAIQGLRPSQFQSPEDDVLLENVSTDTYYKQQEENQKKYEANSRNMQVGQYVYADFNTPGGAFQKGFDSKRNQLFKISRVDAGKSPVLYKIVDLMGDEEPGYWYAKQLVKAPAPKNGQFYKVEKVLKKRRTRGKTYFLCKFQHYPAKFNQWIEEKDLIA
jgi:hypothetical protein